LLIPSHKLRVTDSPVLIVFLAIPVIVLPINSADSNQALPIAFIVFAELSQIAFQKSPIFLRVSNAICFIVRIYGSIILKSPAYARLVNYS
jgi:hypothetical protein